jgi:nucleotide-binding universal stress UspA family protein
MFRESNEDTGMAKPKAKPFRVVVATDGSKDARAAVTAAVHFPWPAHTRVRVVAARRTRAEYRRSILLTALDRNAEAAAERAVRTLSTRWKDVESVVVNEAPVDGILGEAKRFKADVIVLGWRGHGAMRRVLMGSVSRGIVRNAPCAVLVVRRSTRVRRIVLGLDGSATSKRALSLVGTLVPPPDGRVILVTSVDFIAMPSMRRVPGAQGIAHEVKQRNVRLERAALNELNRAAALLRRAGWQARTVLTYGEPLRDLLGTVASGRSQLLVVGARGTSGIRHLLLGSVAEGALNRSPVPVLIAR